MLSLKFKAYGKINPYLYVGEKRSDGFHEVVTVMQKTDVYDVITLTETTANGIVITSDSTLLPNDSQNLVYRAIEEFHKAIGKPIEELETGYTIHVEKNIPIAGGMGGGSADAGYTLKHLNEAMGSPLSHGKLREIAALLGSDVPFFVCESEAMLATGRGEILTDCPSFPTFRTELLSCGKKPSTGTMFAALDRSREENAESFSAPDASDILKALERGNLRDICRNFYNSFQQALTVQDNEYGELFAKASEELTARGAVGVLLCGSGPTVCGIFES